MSLTLKTDPTIAPTGGTSVVFTKLRGEGNVVYYHVLDDSLLTRKKLKHRLTEPKAKVDSPDGYTQGRNELVISQPITTASGGITYNTVKVELSRSVEATDAQIRTLLDYAFETLSSTGAFNSAFVDNGHPE